MLQLRVTLQAELHIEEIGIYTQEEWGIEQRHRYLNDLEQRFMWLLENWELGHERDEIKEGYYSYPHARHVIFYRVTETDLEILGVLHASRDFKRHL